MTEMFWANLKRKGGTFGKCVPINVLGRIMIPDTSSLGSPFRKNESSEKKISQTVHAKYELMKDFVEPDMHFCDFALS